MSNFAIGQGEKYPISVVLFEDFIAYHNASILEREDQILLGTQGQFGAFSEIITFYGIGNHSFGSKKENGIGLAFYSLQEGPLISENRLKLSYWKKININKNLSVVAGAHAGFINTSYKETRSTAGVSTYVSNFDFGLTGKYKKTLLSFAINQIGNSQATPLTQTNIYKTFYTFILSHPFQISPTLTWEAFVYSRVLIGARTSFEEKNVLTIREKMQIGFGAGSEGVLFSFGFKELKMSLPIGFSVAYRFPVLVNESSIFHPYQVQLSYIFK